MKFKALAILSIASLAYVGIAALSSSGANQEQLPELPEDPRAVPVRVVEAQPFRLNEPGTHSYRAEKPTFDSGLLLVLDVADVGLLTPRQTLEPVLYVGDETAQRINTGAGSGHLVVVVPNATVESLAESPIFFGTPDMPERVTRAAARQELSTALAAGIRPGPITASAQREEVLLENHYELYLHASTLIETYSPKEQDLVEAMRAPLLQTR